MSKSYFNKAALGALCVGLIVLLFLVAASPIKSICTAREKCPKPIEYKGGDMLWESLSRQFVTSVSY